MLTEYARHIRKVYSIFMLLIIFEKLAKQW